MFKKSEIDNYIHNHLGKDKFDAIISIISASRGHIIITGKTGSGKSLLAAGLSRSLEAPIQFSLNSDFNIFDSDSFKPIEIKKSQDSLVIYDHVQQWKDYYKLGSNLVRQDKKIDGRLIFVVMTPFDIEDVELFEYVINCFKRTEIIDKKKVFFLDADINSMDDLYNQSL
ncbi:hypothetical protein [Rosenbergiella collisarenosi]|uniref:hypothetical protein n=1 Tax=Rosenbergiella collisarenosi TaxID=1544695 RepID=UPI001F4DEA13|nr:hypothetical protein [Rosenbergiella collisarenosi]